MFPSRLGLARALLLFYLSPGIFAFKCSRAEEIFNLLQDLMQCNSINVLEEPVIITRNSHPSELDLPRGPSQPTGKETPTPGTMSLGGPRQASRLVIAGLSQLSWTFPHHENHS